MLNEGFSIFLLNTYPISNINFKKLLLVVTNEKVLNIFMTLDNFKKIMFRVLKIK